MRTPIVTNLESPRSGNPVANQFVIETEDGEIFQSYRTPIAEKKAGRTYIISSNWNYSRTTSKYFYQWLRSFGFNGLEIDLLCKWLKKAEFGSELVELASMPVNITYVEELK